MRYIEIDIIKSIAIICMVIFHIYYFPNILGYSGFNYNTNTLQLIARIAQILFIGSAGINLYLSYKNNVEKNNDYEEYKRKQIKRIFILCIFAGIISIISYFMFGERWIRFGILHFLSVSSLVLFNYVNNNNVLYGILITTIILYIIALSHPTLFKPISSPISFILGIYNDKYKPIDHFAIIPWISIFIMGILIGKNYYKKDKPETKSNKILEGFSYIGKYSLQIYLIHWVVLYVYFKGSYT